MFSLQWSLYYASEGKPFYIAFRLKDKTPLLEHIEGCYIIDPVGPKTSKISFLLDTRLRGIIPGFVQHKIKQLVLDVAMGSLMKFVQSEEMVRRYRLQPLPPQLALPVEEEMEGDEDAYLDEKYPLYVFLRMRQLLKRGARAVVAAATLQEGTITYRALFETFRLSQRVCSLFDWVGMSARRERASPWLDRVWDSSLDLFANRSSTALVALDCGQRMPRRTAVVPALFYRLSRV